jgi:hypothetical protein
MLLIAYLQQLKGDDETDHGSQGKSIVVTVAGKGLGQARSKEYRDRAAGL